MLKIRLQRFGRKNDPAFRVVVLEGTEGPKSGSHVDQIGTYNAVTKQKSLNKEKAAYWLAKGAQPSDTVYNFLVSEGVIDGKKKNVLPSKSPIVKEAPAEEAAPVAEAPADAPAEDVVAEAPAEESTPVAETPAEESAPEASVEAEPASTETPADEPKTEEVPAA